VEVFIVVAVAAVVGLIVAGVYFSKNARIKRALRKVKAIPIAQVKDGAAAKVVGKLGCLGVPLRAPLTGRPCAYYEVVVEEHRRRGKHSHWVTVIHERNLVDFLLRDQSGKALVKIATAQVALVMDAHFKSGTFNDAHPALEAYLASHGQKSEGWLFNRNLRYREGVLEPEESVAVCGQARWEPDPEPDPGMATGYRESPMRLLLGPAPEIGLLVSDDPTTLE